MDDTHLTNALTICNGCDSATALPDSAAGYCADCDADARATADFIAAHNKARSAAIARMVADRAAAVTAPDLGGKAAPWS